MKIGGRNINNLRYANYTILLTESSNDLKILLVKEESARVGLQLNIKTKIMITMEKHNFDIDNEEIEVARDFVHLGSTTSPN